MRAAIVAGRSIVAISQSRYVSEATGRRVVALDAIELDNGTTIVFSAHEDYNGSWVQATAYRNGKRLK